MKWIKSEVHFDHFDQHAQEVTLATIGVWSSKPPSNGQDGASRAAHPL
jgi:hypothetical protein